MNIREQHIHTLVLLMTRSQAVTLRVALCGRSLKRNKYHELSLLASLSDFSENKMATEV
jgi:hypothetical protein